jgi:hypothetical protein
MIPAQFGCWLGLFWVTLKMSVLGCVSQNQNLTPGLNIALLEASLKEGEGTSVGAGSCWLQSSRWRYPGRCMFALLPSCRSGWTQHQSLHARKKHVTWHLQGDSAKKKKKKTKKGERGFIGWVLLKCGRKVRQLQSLINYRKSWGWAQLGPGQTSCEESLVFLVKRKIQ